MRGRRRYSVLVKENANHALTRHMLGIPDDALARIEALTITGPQDAFVRFAIGNNYTTLAPGEWEDLEWDLPAGGLVLFAREGYHRDEAAVVVTFHIRQLQAQALDRERAVSNATHGNYTASALVSRLEDEGWTIAPLAPERRGSPAPSESKEAAKTGCPICDLWGCTECVEIARKAIVFRS